VRRILSLLTLCWQRSFDTYRCVEYFGRDNLYAIFRVYRSYIVCMIGLNEALLTITVSTPLY